MAKKTKELKNVEKILNANKNKNFVQRILDPTTVTPLDRGGGWTSSHSMEWGESDGKYYVYPTVIERDGKLVDIKEEGEDALDYALKNNEFIEFDKKEEAAHFSSDEGYKQYWEQNDTKQKKKRSIWKKKEESETSQVESPVEKKTSKDDYTHQKEKFLADERLGGMDFEQKKRALGKFFDIYGVPYVQGSSISDKNQLDRFKQRFVDENIANIPEPKAKKKDEVSGYEPPAWLEDAPSEDISPKADVTQPVIPPDTVEKEEAARRSMGLATGLPAVIKAPPPESPPENTEAIAKDPQMITPQGSNKTSTQKTVMDWVELSYVEKGWPSPMNKVSEFYERSAELQREVQTGKMNEEDYNQKIDELAGEIGIGRKENGDLYLYQDEMAKYKEEMGKQYRAYLNRQKEEAKDGFVKDFFQALSIGAEDVLNTGTRILSLTEGISNELLRLFDSDREGPTYWKDKAALEAEIVDHHRADNKRYDESITELLAAGKTGKAAMQTALSAAEALPRLSVLAMGNAVGLTNLTLGWMGTDKAIQQYMNTENEPNMTRAARAFNAAGHGFSEAMWESMGTVKLLNAGRRAIKEMGEDVVRKELMKAYTPFLQRQMAIWDKGVSAMMREAGEEGATSLTDDMMDIMSGIKTFDQFGETVLDEMIVGGVIGFGLGSPQMIAESGGKSKYVKNIAKTIPEDFDIESKLALASMIVKYDQQRWLMNEAPEGMKEEYKAQMAHTQDLINDMMARGEFVPTKVAPNIQTFAEKLRDGKLPVEEEVKEEPAKPKEKPTEKPKAAPKPAEKPPVEEKPIEKPKPEKEPVIKELTDEQKAHNNLVAKVRSYNAIPTQNTAQRSKAMGPITRMAQQMGYGLTTEKGKLVALSDKGKRIKLLSIPGEYRSLKEVENPKFQKFANEFLEDENMIINLGIQLYGKKLRKAREDVIGEKKNQSSDMLIRELERMYNEGYIEIREADATKRIPVADIEALIEEPKLTKFIKEHGVLDATNIDQALEAGLINKEDYETTKQQLEDELTQRAEEEAEPGVEEAGERPPDIEGAEYDVEKPWTYDTQFMDKAALTERIEVAEKTLKALDKMEAEGRTGSVTDPDANLTNDNTMQLFGKGRNKVTSPEDIPRLKALAQEAIMTSKNAQQEMEALPAKAEGVIRYGGRDFASEEELAEELSKYPTERLPLPEMDIQIARAIEKAGKIREEREAPARKKKKLTEKKSTLKADLEAEVKDIEGKPVFEKLGTIPIKSLRGKEVTMDVEVEETGKIVKEEMDALEAYRDIKMQESILKKLTDCIG